MYLPRTFPSTSIEKVIVSSTFHNSRYGAIPSKFYVSTLFFQTLAFLNLVYLLKTYQWSNSKMSWQIFPQKKNGSKLNGDHCYTYRTLRHTYQTLRRTYKTPRPTCTWLLKHFHAEILCKPTIGTRLTMSSSRSYSRSSKFLDDWRCLATSKGEEEPYENILC